MRPHVRTALVAGGAVVGAVTLAGPATAAALTSAGRAHPAAAGVRWGRAVQVPGLGKLNVGGNAEVVSLSCPRAGDCVAGGFYQSSRRRDALGEYPLQAFLVSQHGGGWGRAVQAPGSAVLNKGGSAQVSSVSCASAGNCSAGGYYTDRNGGRQAFLLTERNGRWSPARQVPGTARLNRAARAAVTSVSCARAGDCAAGGYYQTVSYRGGEGYLAEQAFAVTERNGRWGTALEVPGLAAVGTAGEIDAVSCSSAGNCTAGGYYATTVDNAGYVAFTAAQAAGRWGTLQAVPGQFGLEAAVLTALSCPSAGNCGAGGADGWRLGYYPNDGFVAGETDGSFAPLVDVIEGAAQAEIVSVSCRSAGDCGAGGYGGGAADVAGEQGGSWGAAEQVPGTGALNKGGAAQVTSVSCGSAVSCVAGGFYTDQFGRTQAFVGGAR